ncbi:MAG TPA: Calx-beta domain-containing protein [Flavisolibacter sp.]|nr:Calx-beta domain-containing protein [Flavisolibacter sp.]
MKPFFTLLLFGVSLPFMEQMRTAFIANERHNTFESAGSSANANPITSRSNSVVTSFLENFDDGNITANPIWEGNTTAFALSSSSPLAGSHDMRSNTGSTLASIHTQIGTATNLSDGAYTWEFLYKDNAGNPSSPNSNGWRFFLAANSSNPATAQGYAIRHGNSGSPDNIELVAMNNGSETVLINSNVDPGTAAHSIKVIRSATGNWSLFVDAGTTTATTQRGASVNHSTYFGTGSSNIFLVLQASNTSSAPNPFRFRWDNILFKKVTMQASLKTGAENEVSLYLKPSASFAQKDEKLNLALAVPASITPAPSTGTSGVENNVTGPVANISGLAPNITFLNLGSVSRETIVSQQTINGQPYFIYTLLFTGVAGSNHIWVENVEQKILSVRFNGCGTNFNPQQVLLVSLANGGNQSNSLFGFQPHDLGNVTNQAESFYANADTEIPANGGATTQTSLLSLVSTNAQPIISSDGGTTIVNKTIAENTTSVTDVDATDANSDPLTYRIACGADASRFLINSATGVLTFVTAPDYETPQDVDANNSYEVVVRASDGKTAIDQTINVTVTDVAELPSLSISDVSSAEGNSGSTTFNFTVNLSSPAPTGGVTFDIATADGSAIAGTDYTAHAITAATIPANASSYTFAVTVSADTDVEPDESFAVTISNVNGATIGDGQATGNILNDDWPVLSINDVCLNEGNSGTTSFTFTVTASQPAPAGGISVNYATSTLSATATAGSDYTAASGVATIAAGTTTATISISVQGDVEVEGDETFSVELSNAVAATLVGGKSSGLGTIRNDDMPPANEPPVITSDGGGAMAAKTVVENTTAVTDVNATDPNPGTTIVYSISGGADAALFSMDASTGMLAFIAATVFSNPADADGDNVYHVTIKASDGILFDEQAIVITVVKAASVLQTVTSDPALVDVQIEKNNTAINANLLPYDSTYTIKLPIINLHLLSAVPAGTTKVRIDLGKKLKIANASSLATALPTEFNWTLTDSAGHDVLWGAQVAALPVDYDKMALFTVKATEAGNAGIKSDVLVTNHNNNQYSLQDANAANNSAELQYNVLQQFVAAAVATVNNTCYGGAIGSVDALATGGLSPYEYSINNGATWQTATLFTGLAAGSYTITAKDALGQTTSFTHAVTQPAELSATVSSTHVSCNGTADGTITVSNAQGGFGTYEYSINGGATWQAYGSFASLAAGTYTLQIRDAANPGCTKVLNSNIVINPVLSLVVKSSTNNTCAGSAEGMIEVEAAGGSLVYQYQAGNQPWQQSPVFTGLAAGTYTIKVKDEAGCVKEVTHTITEPTNTDVTIGSNITDNIFLQNGSEQTIVYNLNEVLGKAATTATIRIFKPAGYNIVFEQSAGSWQNPVSGQTETLDNSKWAMSASTASYVEYSRTLSGANNTILCNERNVRVAFKLVRATPNKSKFNLNAQFRPAATEQQLSNNTNSIVFTGE